MNKHSFKRLCFISVVSIFVSSCGGSSEKETIPTPNVPPVAGAGIDQTIDEQTVVTLSGSGNDSDGSIVSYQWTQITGTEVVIADADKAITSFSAPVSAASETLSFQLTVTDNDGAQASDIVDVNILKLNKLPIANAGQGTEVFVADMVTLNCSGSNDPDGDALTYYWQQTEGAMATISDDSICQPQFKVPNKAGDYEFTLTVTDVLNGKDTAQVSYSAKQYEGEINNWQHNHLFTYGTLPEQASDFVTVSGDFAYIGSAYEGWWIVDVSAPVSPVLVSKVASSSRVNEISVDGEYAFISTEGGLKIYDVSTPTIPMEVAEVDIKQGVNSTVVVDNFLYAITNNRVPKGGFNFLPDDSLPDFFRIDISTVTSPKIVTSIHTESEPKAISIKDSNAYIIDGDKGLKIIDISDVDALPIVSSLRGLGELFDLLMKEDKAYAWSEDGMKVIDIANPSEPELVGELEYSAFWYRGYNSIQMLGEQLLLGIESTLNLIDISNPTSPKWNGRMNVTGTAMYVRNGIIYSAGDSGLSIQDGSVIVKSSLQSQLPSKATISLKIEEDILFATNWLASYEIFETIDISTPKEPSFLGDYKAKPFDFDWNLPIASWDVEGNKAFIVNNTLDSDEITWLSKLSVLDTTDSTSPTLLDTLDLGGDIYSIKVQKDLVYAVVQDVERYPLTEFRIFNISDLYSPELKGFIPTSLENEIAIEGDVAYLSGNSLQIVDVSSSNSPKLLGELEVKGHISSIENNIAYIKDNENRLKLVDVSNLAAPKILDFTDTIGRFSDISVNVDIAYVSSANEGLKVYDISNPSSPLLERTIGTQGSVSQSQIQNKHIFITDSKGLLVLDNENFDTTSLINSDQRYHSVSKSSVLEYSVAWNTDSAIAIKCLVTGGSCQVIVDKQNKSAEVLWTAPEVDGDYEIVIIGGNTSSQEVIRDRVSSK